MHSQLIFFNAYLSFFNRNKRIAVTPGISGETIGSCRRPLLFESRALCEIDLLRHNNKSHVLLRVMTKIPKQRQSDSSMKVRIKCINAVSNKSE